MKIIKKSMKSERKFPDAIGGGFLFSNLGAREYHFDCGYGVGPASGRDRCGVFSIAFGDLHPF